MSRNITRKIKALQKLGLDENVSVYLTTGSEEILEELKYEIEEIANEAVNFVPLHQTINLDDFQDIHPIQENVRLTDNPMRNSVKKKIGKIVLTDTGRKIVYDE
jgi:Fe-S-cluster formation regulator IscX/YfhJ